MFKFCLHGYVLTFDLQLHSPASHFGSSTSGQTDVDSTVADIGSEQVQRKVPGLQSVWVHAGPAAEGAALVTEVISCGISEVHRLWAGLTPCPPGRGVGV